jgi:uncharacterized protein YcbX
MAGMELSRIYVFPVKSACGIAVDEWEVGDRGFVGDRRFMVVDAAGRFVTQRTQPRMALVEVALDRERVVMRAPGMAPLLVPRRPATGEARRVVVWDDEVEARAVGDEAAAWWSELLAMPCALVWMPEETRRAVDPARAEGHLVGFADAYPFLLASTTSLEELARRGARVEMIRFRPNLVVDGASEPFEEDRWKTIAIGGVRFRAVKPCSRCSITTVDPATAEVGKEPLKTLAEFRQDGREVFFGVNLVAEGRGVVRVGASVEVLD